MHPPSTDSPQAWTLAAVLREIRRRVGISQRKLADRIGVANTTVSRWEKGEIVPKPEDVSKVLTHLGIDGAEREKILTLASGSDSENWLAPGTPGMSKQLSGVMKYEQTARHVTEWAPLVIPGVLQTSAYARAILSAHGTVSPNDAEARLALRMARRDAVMRRLNPTPLVALIGEPAIHGGIGGREVMIDQLRYLLDAIERDNVTLQVVSVDCEWHPGHAGAFIMYELVEPRRPVVFFEHHRSGGLLVDASDIQDYQRAIAIIRHVGMSPDDSRELITSHIRSLEETP